MVYTGLPKFTSVCPPMGVAHTVLKRWRKSHHVTNDMMFGTYDWFSVSNTKKVQLDAVDHLVGGFLEEGHNQTINLIAMLLDRLVLGLLNLLHEIKIAFHAFQLKCIVLSIGIHACNATGHNRFLD